eukprot:TRINITY_DN15788_c0_g1_i2.p1 TRINITY_DN15788_c0_g1~~TRINITY_DN15788_c0_g1_i2.p1  ORF type:complete len:127 (-),score=28.34 TRINITY_DN15788_c0_g1_i2:10-390(-)
MVVLSGVPKLHEVVRQTPLEDKVMRIGDISAVFISHIKSKSLEYLEKNKPRLTGYGAITIICMVIDLGLLLAGFWSFFTADLVTLCELIRIVEAPMYSPCTLRLSLIHICRCRRYAVCRSRWSPYH